MTEAAIFVAGSLVFIATAWATFAFGVTRFRELQIQDMADADVPVSVRSEGPFTEVWIPEAAAESPPVSTTGQGG